MSRFARHTLLLALGFAAALSVGCGNKDKDAPPGGPGGPPGGGPPGGGPPGGGPPGGGPPSMPGVMEPDQVLAKLPGGNEHAAGKKAYANVRCAACHKLGETGGAPPMPPMPPMPGGPGGPGGGPPGGPPMPPMPGGPNLTEVGTTRTKEWIADHIRQPSKHTKDSRMPPFGADKISDADLSELAAYLASRKPADPKPKDGKDPKDGKTPKDGKNPKDTGGGAKKDPTP